MLNPFLLVVVMEALTSEIIEGLPWEILYADDLMLLTESKKSLKKKRLVWKEQLNRKSMRLNAKKTKFMSSGKNFGETKKDANWPCVICGKGVGSNFIHCISCNEWVHKRCSGVKSYLRIVCGISPCKMCARGNHDNRIAIDFGIDLGNEKNLERVGKFCYLREVLNGNRGCINRRDTMRMRKIYEID